LKVSLVPILILATHNNTSPVTATKRHKTAQPL
jgi:hypothetical protein